MTVPIEILKMPMKELRDRQAALEDEAELVRAVIRQRAKQERSRQRIALAVANIDAEDAAKGARA